MTRHAEADCGRAARRLAAAVLIVIAVAASSAAQVPQPGPDPPTAQTPPSAPDPRAAQPERPSVATHAFAVAPGYVELETGFQRQQQGELADQIAVPILVKIGLARRLQLDIAPGFQRDADSGRAESGLTDLLLALKWRMTDGAPVLGAFAVQTTVSLPTGSAQSGRGTGSAAVNLLAISSHSVGSVDIDVNAGYTRRGGDSTIAPRNATLWACAAAFPLPGSVGWVAEVFGLPGTTGPAGEPPVVGFLTGPSFTLKPSLVLDAGAIFDVSRFGSTAIYGGLTWNMGRAWGRSPSPALLPRAGW